ncbi:DUF6241 domain-containing protein [Neobacillus sp. NPDC097160]|uniref:DUF6241 domain-containing protein n=1 Tax=Neobacillus sp. NPDC097160 TaxID=3364298 RepID=UPI0037F1308D
MKKLIKNLSWTKGVIIVLLAVIVLGSYYYFSKGSLPFQKDAVTVKVEKTKEGETVVKMEDTNSSKIEREFPTDMSEDEVMDAIHKMSHQKVRADKKWGAIPLTPERVNRLMQVVRDNYAQYKGSNVYIDILTRWSNGDFSRVDHDHNQVWELQGGTIGAAEGIASVEEEQEFIEEHFNVVQ